MNKTADLINALSYNAEPVKPAASPRGIFFKWLGYSIVYEIILIAISGLRPDLMAKFHSNLFIAEISILALTVITSALSAVYLSFPDLYQRKLLVYLPAIPFIAFMALLYYAWINEPLNLPPVKAHGLECLICVALFSSFSAIAMIYFLKKQATTHYYLTGSVAFLASSSLGALAFGFCEPEDSVAHLVTWHYLPMLGFMIIGMAAGRKFLRW